MQYAFFTLLLLPYDAAHSGGTTGSGQPAVEDGGAAWHWPTMSMPGLGPANDDALSWPSGLRMAEDGTWHGALRDEGAAGDEGTVGDGGGDAPDRGTMGDGGTSRDGSTTP